MKRKELLNNIESKFPILDSMPSQDRILFDDNNMDMLGGLAKDIIEEINGNVVTGDNIRLIHQDLSNLSAEFWYWVMPHYLRYCLTSEAEYQQTEIQFLIYALSPESVFEADTSKKLILFNDGQLRCLIDFLDFFSTQEYFDETHSINRARGKQFLEQEIAKAK